MVSIIKGYKCILSVSDKTKPEKIAYLKALGATVYVCPASVPADDPRSYYEVAKKIAAETPNSIYINQYFNELNIDAHYFLLVQKFGNRQKEKSLIFLLVQELGNTFWFC